MTPIIHPHLRWRVLNWLHCGEFEDSVIESGCYFQGTRILVGSGAYMNAGVIILSSAPVSIGRNTYLGPGAQLIGVSHEIGHRDQRAGRNTSLPITLEPGCWIGAGAIVLPGVTVGSGCIVGAGAVVTNDCEPDGLYAGIPARRIRTLEGDESLTPREDHRPHE